MLMELFCIMIVMVIHEATPVIKLYTTKHTHVRAHNQKKTWGNLSIR